MAQNRRKFISTVTLAGASIPFAAGLKSLLPGMSENKHYVRLFSKPLDGYDFGFMCECALRSGISGFELTVRPGGKVEPANVENELPKIVDEAKRSGLVVDMMVSAIISASDPFTERVLKTAASVGIKHYRLGYFDYDKGSGVMESLQRVKSTLNEISGINRKYNISGSYQNHAGTGVGGAVWDLYELFHDLPSGHLGVQYDVRHAMAEGFNAWVIGMRLISSYIHTLAIKDFTFENVNGKPQAVTVPLGEGIVDWDLFFKMVNELKINVPITLHVEYPLLEGGEEKLSLSRQQDIIVGKLKKDMSFLNTYLSKYNLT